MEYINNCTGRLLSGRQPTYAIVLVEIHDPWKLVFLDGCLSEAEATKAKSI